MMRKTLTWLLLLLFHLCASTNAQTVESLRIKYEQFDYQAVVEQARTLLQHRARLDSATVKEALLLSAMSQYSLLNVDAGMVDFLELLRLDPQFQLDPVKTSPKIVQFFNEIKQSVHREPERERVVVRVDTVATLVDVGRPLAAALKRSMLWPGWGQCYLGDRSKGRILRTASVLTCAAAAWATVDCRNKEKAYLNTTSRALMNQRYQHYNRSYKTRNILWGSFAAVWLYSQFDLLYLYKTSPTTIGLRARPSYLSLFCEIPLTGNIIR